MHLAQLNKICGGGGGNDDGQKQGNMQMTYGKLGIMWKREPELLDPDLNHLSSLWSFKQQNQGLAKDPDSPVT